MSLSDFRVHPDVAVSDMGRAAEFYERTLGLADVQETGDGGRTYRCGEGTTLHIFPSPHAGQTAATTAGWDAGQRFEALVDELASRGLSFEQYEEPVKTDEKGIATFGDVKIAWFRDPDGNTFGISNR
jgi:catechol 2,3-dioxygenase-like lactoylglutathione lyase family enzyme